MLNTVVRPGIPYFVAMLTRSEEDHLKAIHALLAKGAAVATNDIAAALGIKASSVPVMLKKLTGKGLLKYAPYHGVRLTAKGSGYALQLVRKHRLWETFLVERLGFGWHEVHEVAEQMEHVSNEKLVERLDEYLGFPAFDPHGDPIPDRDGKVRERPTRRLTSCAQGETVRIAAVSETTDGLLRLLDARGLRIGSQLTIAEVQAFDGSLDLKPKRGPIFTLSKEVAHHLQVEVAG